MMTMCCCERMRIGYPKTGLIIFQFNKNFNYQLNQRKNSDLHLFFNLTILYMMTLLVLLKVPNDKINRVLKKDKDFMN